MDYREIDFSKDIEEIMTNMDYNFEVLGLKQKEINRLENFKNITPEKETSFADNDIPKISKKENSNASFEKKVKPYIDKAKIIEHKKDLLSILPLRDDYDFEKIMIRLMAESLKDIKDYLEMNTFELNQEERLQIKKEIKWERNKISIFQAILKESKEEIKEMQEVQENNLIFVPTVSGNIRVLNEIESIDIEYYQRFYGLFQSIKNGTFKNVKSLSGNEFVSIYEVRDTNVRVVYQLLDKNNYAIITSFVKRSSNEGGYRDKLGNKIANYFNVKETLKENLNNSKFIDENKKYEEQLFNMLKTNIKGQSR